MISKEYEKLLRKLQNGSINQINRHYITMLNDLTKIINNFKNTDPRINKTLRRQINQIKRNFVNSYNATLTTYNGKAISLSQRKNALIIQKQIEGLEVEMDMIKNWLGRPNTPQVKIVSKSVWNVNKGFYKNLDTTLKSGLLEGKSAHEIKLQLTRLLNNPHSLDINELRNKGFDEVGGEKEYRKLEKEVINYKSGRGVYKSAKKNAFRLARNEINRAYRQQDTDTRQNLPFIKGIEVKLSASHPREDICDSLVGVYPKDYNFLGFHPACLCYSVPILATKEETARLIAGQNVNIHPVKNIPKRATNYIKSKKEVINNLKTTPFFIQENEKYFKKII